MRKWKIILLLAYSLVLSGCGTKEKSTENIDQGNLALGEEKYQEALGSFQAALNGQEDLVLSYRGEGIAYMGMGNYADAVQSFQNALSAVKPSQNEIIQDLRLYKAAAEYKMGAYENCEVTCTEILAVDELSQAYYLKAACEMEQGEIDQAEADFDAAVLLNSDDYDLYLNIYEIYRGKNLSSDGGKYLEQALSLGGNSAEDLYQRGMIYYYLGNYEKAKEQLGSAAAQGHGPSILLLSQVNIETDNIESAQTLAQQYLTDIEETPEAYNVMTLVYLAQGNYDAALEQINKGLALEIEEGKQDLLFNEIVAYEKKLDFQTAKAKAEAYVNLYPSDEQGQKEYEFLMTR